MQHIDFHGLTGWSITCTESYMEWDGQLSLLDGQRGRLTIYNVIHHRAVQTNLRGQI